jgi:GLPGLI family protein
VIRFLILSAFLLGSLSLVHGQKVKEGSFHYKVKHIDGADLGDTTVVSTIARMGMRVTVKGNFYKVDVLGLQEFSFIMDYSTNTVFTLVDMNGRKLAIKSTIEKYQENLSNMPAYLYSEDGTTSKINGYTCYKAIVRRDDGKTLNFYYAKKLRYWNKQFLHQYKEIPGIALEFDQTDQLGTIYTYTINQIDLSPVDISVFLVPGEYEIMTEAELHKMMMGQME